MLKNVIYEGSCIEGLKEIDDESVDIIIADPPYNIGKDFGICKDNLELNDYLNWSDLWIKECLRILKRSGSLYIYGFSEILAHISVRINENKRWLVWYYKNKVTPNSLFWQRNHESILLVYKDNITFNTDSVRISYTDGFLNNADGKKRANTKGRFGNKDTFYTVNPFGALPRDVIEVPNLAGGSGSQERFFLCKTCDKVYHPKYLKDHENHDILKHPTQKPLKLTETLIKAALPLGRGLVVVPFCGSGSECVGSKKLNQDFLSWEINIDYIKIANYWLHSSEKGGLRKKLSRK